MRSIPKQRGNIPVPAVRKVPMGILKERSMVTPPKRKITIPPMISSLFKNYSFLTMNYQRAKRNSIFRRFMVHGSLYIVHRPLFIVFHSVHPCSPIHVENLTRNERCLIRGQKEHGFCYILWFSEATERDGGNDLFSSLL